MLSLIFPELSSLLLLVFFTNSVKGQEVPKVVGKKDQQQRVGNGVVFVA